MGITRNFIFAIDPYLPQGDLGPGLCSTLSFTAVPDGNDSEKSFSCGYAPLTRGSGVSIAQETLFIGTNAEAGYTYQTLKDNLTQDGSNPVVAEFITRRLDPDSRPGSGNRESSTKRYENLDFNGPSILELGGSIYWTKDCNPIRDNTVSWKEFTYNSGDTGLYFEKGLGNWVHIKGVCSGASAGDILLSAFTLRYRYVGRGIEGRDS